MSNLNNLYSKKVLDHFYHPRNMGEIKSPDGKATVGNPVCGDVMRIFIKVAKKQKPRLAGGQAKTESYIKDIKFQTLGCGAAIATSSILTEMVKGKSLNEAEKVSKQAVIEALDGLPSAKTHCSVLAVEALKKAIENFRQKKIK